MAAALLFALSCGKYSAPFWPQAERHAVKTDNDKKNINGVVFANVFRPVFFSIFVSPLVVVFYRPIQLSTASSLAKRYRCLIASLALTAACLTCTGAVPPK